MQGGVQRTRKSIRSFFGWAGSPYRPGSSPEDDELAEILKAQTFTLSGFSSVHNVNSFFDAVALPYPGVGLAFLRIYVMMWLKFLTLDF